MQWRVRGERRRSRNEALETLCGVVRVSADVTRVDRFSFGVSWLRLSAHAGPRLSQ